MGRHALYLSGHGPLLFYSLHQTPHRDIQTQLQKHAAVSRPIRSSAERATATTTRATDAAMGTTLPWSSTCQPPATATATATAMAGSATAASQLSGACVSAAVASPGATAAGLSACRTGQYGCSGPVATSSSRTTTIAVSRSPALSVSGAYQPTAHISSGTSTRPCIFRRTTCLRRSRACCPVPFARPGK